MIAMIEAKGRSLRSPATLRFPVLAITGAAMLLLASSIVLAQEKLSNPLTLSRDGKMMVVKIKLRRLI